MLNIEVDKLWKQGRSSFRENDAKGLFDLLGAKATVGEAVRGSVEKNRERDSSAEI